MNNINWKFPPEMPQLGHRVWIPIDVDYPDQKQIVEATYIAGDTACFKGNDYKVEAWCELDEIPLPVKRHECRQGSIRCVENGGFLELWQLVDASPGHEAQAGLLGNLNFCPICGEESPAHRKGNDMVSHPQAGNIKIKGRE